MHTHKAGDDGFACEVKDLRIRAANGIDELDGQDCKAIILLPAISMRMSLCGSDPVPSMSVTWSSTRTGALTLMYGARGDGFCWAVDKAEPRDKTAAINAMRHRSNHGRPIS
jgi:hypothetical protein